MGQLPQLADRVVETSGWEAGGHLGPSGGTQILQTHQIAAQVGSLLAIADL